MGVARGQRRLGRNIYVVSSESSQSNGSKEEEEYEEREKVVGNGGVTKGAMSGSGVARRDSTQSKRSAASVWGFEKRLNAKKGGEKEDGCHKLGS
jgi:hypothetical protein